MNLSVERDSRTPKKAKTKKKQKEPGRKGKKNFFSFLVSSPFKEGDGKFHLTKRKVKVNKKE